MVLHSKESTTIIKRCVYCEGDHRSAECQNIFSTSERKKILSEKRLSGKNSTGKKHRAINCTSNQLCLICNKNHHTSICNSGNQVMLTTSIVIKVEGVICRALIDSGSGSSYVSAVLAIKINKKTKKKEPKKIEMMFYTTTKWVEISDVTIQNIKGNFELKTQLNKVEKDTLLSLPNPNYLEIISHYPHLNDIKLNDIVKKKELPVHVILGVSDYAKIKMQERPRIGQPGDPIAELTRFGWFIMSPGHESNLTHLLFSNTSAQDYKKLCSLDVLGIEENHNLKDTEILDRFKKQLKQSD